MCGGLVPRRAADKYAPATGHISRRLISQHPQHRAEGDTRPEPANSIDLRKRISTMRWYHPGEIETALAALRACFRLSIGRFGTAAKKPHRLRS
jgi:hypothetical protein